MARAFRIALIGFGSVGHGFIEILARRLPWIEERFGVSVLVSGIATRQHGTLYNPDGLKLGLLNQWPRERSQMEAFEVPWDSLTLIREGNFHAMLEVTPTLLKQPEASLAHCHAALDRGMHILCANKAPVAHDYQNLAARARAAKIQLGFEACVMAGTPCIQLLQTLQACGIKRILGVLNGTCNFILEQMGTGRSFEASLQEAIRQGYAEPDPSADIDGLDTLAKAMILARLGFNQEIRLEETSCKGIRNYPMEQVQQARQLGSRIKLVADIKAHQIRVLPQAYDASHPLSQATGAANGILVETEDMGPVYLQGAGAGPRETGSALVQDLVRCLI